jgi:hypothetical protein
MGPPGLPFLRLVMHAMVSDPGEVDKLYHTESVHIGFRIVNYVALPA